MNKSQLIDALSERFEGGRTEAAEALEIVLDTITRQVAKGEKVAITGFGSFEKTVRKARTVRNPQTGESMRSKRKTVPKFTAGQDLKNVISGAKKLPALPRPPKPPGAGTAKKTAAKKAPAKKTTAAKKAPAKKTTAAKKAPAKKTTAAKGTTPKSAAPPGPGTLPRPPKPPGAGTAKKTAAKKAPVKKAVAAKKVSAKKTAKTSRR